MGKKLFIRSGKGVTLTPTGEKYLRDVSAAMSAIGRATEQVMKEADNPVLRVHSSPTFGLTWLLRRLGKFRSEYPDITVNLSCSYETCSLHAITSILIFATASRTGTLTGS